MRRPITSFLAIILLLEIGGNFLVHAQSGGAASVYVPNPSSLTIELSNIEPDPPNSKHPQIIFGPGGGPGSSPIFEEPPKLTIRAN